MKSRQGRKPPPAGWAAAVLLAAACLLLWPPRRALAQEDVLQPIMEETAGKAGAPAEEQPAIEPEAGAGSETQADEEAEEGGPAAEYSARDFFEKGLEYHGKGDFSSAVELYQYAVAKEPENGEYHAYLGEALRRMGPEFKRLAIKALKKGIELDPNISVAYTNLGVIYDDDRLFPLGALNHRLALRVDPSNYYARFNLGSSYDKMGLTSAALENYDQVLEDNPDFAPAYNSIGIIYLKQKRVDEAAEMFKSAIAKSEGSLEFGDGLATYYNDLASAYAWMQNYKGARDAYRKAIQTAPPGMPGLEIIQENLKFIEENFSLEPQSR